VCLYENTYSWVYARVGGGDAEPQICAPCCCCCCCCCCC